VYPALPSGSEDLADNEDDLLLHLLVSDFRRQARTAHESHDFALSDAVLALLDWGIVEGGETLDNAIAVSFVEDSAWWESGGAARSQPEVKPQARLVSQRRRIWSRDVRRQAAV
jgi:hypothetical protein